MELLIALVVLGLIPGMIASSKGESFGVWWLYGMLIFPVALVHSLLISPDIKTTQRRQRIAEYRQLQTGEKRQCPSCAELVKYEATVCRFCQRDLPYIETNNGMTFKYKEVR